MTLEILISDTLTPLRHGFFTRRGGASSGVFHGLNCGNGSSDQTDVVSINRARVAQALDVPPAALVSANQVHSADVLTVEAIVDGGAGTLGRGDALVTATPGVALSVLTADCMPVLLADHDAGVVGAVHAGWRGALAGVLEATLDAMEALGAAREDITAVIGPCISQRAYEVGPEFLETFMAEEAGYDRFFTAGTGDRYLFDLPGFGLKRLRDAGVGHAEWTRHCTHSQPDLFYSYRRATQMGEADYGRLISAIRL
jgi:polyphenol oxidase